jgi:PRD1 phage membrane DNA delivery
MTDQLFGTVATVAMAIVGVAILAVLVSKNAQTPAVIQAATSGFASDLAVAVSPVSGGFSAFTGGGVSPIQSF